MTDVSGTDSQPSRGGGAPQSVTFNRLELNRILDFMAAWSPPANGATTPSTF